MPVQSPALRLPGGAPARFELAVPRALAVVVAQVSLAGAALLYLNRTVAGDIYFLLASGRYVDANGVVGRSPFPTLSEGRTWHNQQWLVEWLFFQVHGLGGMALVSVAYSLLLAVALVPLARACAGRSRSALAGAWALGLLCTIAVLDPRAGGFGLVLFTAVIGALEASRRRRRWLFALPPLFVVWANVHGSFPAGLLLVGLFGLAAIVRSRPGARPALEPRAALPYLAALGASTLALLLSPLGTRMVAYLRYYDEHISPSRLPFEWQSTFLHPPVFALVVGFAALAVWLWRRAARPRDLAPALVAAAFLVLAMTAVRQVVWLGPLAFYLVLALAPPTEVSRPTRHASTLAALGLVLVAGWWALVGPARRGHPRPPPRPARRSNGPRRAAGC